MHISLKTVRFLYIHGFASSPSSRKAQAFDAALRARGAELEIPAMDEGDFEHLTISAQLAVMERMLHGDPACLIGSSMGGYLAALYASEHPEIAKIVLLAPAFAFAGRWKDKAEQSYRALPAAEWLEVYHYGEKRMRRVHSRLIEEALGFPPYPAFRQSALIFHGTHDDTAPVEHSRDFAAAHTNAALIELDSDHELLDVLDRITAEALDFLLGREVNENA
jgi:uncharacterized protein